MIYKNGDERVFAKGTFGDRSQAEPDATAFVDDATVFADQATDLKAGGVDKFTVVIWVEGNDPECVDAIRGGFIRSQIVFDVVPEVKG